MNFGVSTDLGNTLWQKKPLPNAIAPTNAYVFILKVLMLGLMFVRLLEYSLSWYSFEEYTHSSA